MNVLRGTLFALAFSLPVWALAAAFVSRWLFLGLMVAGMVALTLAVLARRPDGDCGYDTTPFGIEAAQRSPVSTETVHTPPVALTVIDGGKRAVWPHEAGAPE